MLLELVLLLVLELLLLPRLTTGTTTEAWATTTAASDWPATRR